MNTNNTNNDNTQTNIFDNLKIIFDCINKITEENKLLGDVLFNNFVTIIETINTSKDKKELDVSEQIILLSNLLGFDLEQIIKGVINKENLEVDEETLNFITNTSENINNSIDDYEVFLKNSKIKENMEFLKGEI